MKPDRQTYEAWLLDHAEGRLTPEQERALEAFLGANPDLVPATGSLPRVDTKPMAYPDRQALHKVFPPAGEPDAARLDDFLVARMEKDLGLEQERALTRYLRDHPTAERQAELMALARIEAEPIEYPDKDGLKKQRGKVIPLWWRLAVAASVLLVIGLGVWYFTGTGGDDVQVADKDDRGVTIPEKRTSPEEEGKADDSVGVFAEPATEDGMQEQEAGEEDAARPGSRRWQPVPEKAPGRAMAAREATRPADLGRRAPLPEVINVEPVAAIPEMPVERPVPIQGKTDHAPLVVLPAEEPGPSPSASKEAQAQTLGQALANTTRKRVLNTGRRRSGLDEEDLLAMADKVVGAVAPGGGVEMDRNEMGSRLRLRLGRNVSVSLGLGR